MEATVQGGRRLVDQTQDPRSSPWVVVPPQAPPMRLNWLVCLCFGVGTMLLYWHVWDLEWRLSCLETNLELRLLKRLQQQNHQSVRSMLRDPFVVGAGPHDRVPRQAPLTSEDSCICPPGPAGKTGRRGRPGKKADQGDPGPPGLMGPAGKNGFP
ncbi:unnamed protein product, partial [Meganyctiphanes norvegica]